MLTSDNFDISEDMTALLDWLEAQGGGVRTYQLFQSRVLELAQVYPEHAAACRLLADLAHQFAYAFDGMPLSVDVATAAHARLRSYVAQFATVRGERDTLALLNRVAVDQLHQGAE